MNVCTAFLFRFTSSHSSVTLGKHAGAFNTAHHRLMQTGEAAQEHLWMAIVINKRKDKYIQYIYIHSTRFTSIHPCLFIYVFIY